MATVWRARDEWTREIVAIKQLHPHVVADPVARARLEREAEALRTVDHPAIVRPRGLIDDPDAPSLVMDFVSGRPLSERIAEGPLRPEEAVAIAGIVADALAVAHDHGIVHRDIKPANILVDDDGAVHLVDFGIAALMDAPSDGLTADSTMVGTLRYAAPERLAGGEVTPRSDVWALGAVLYEMLTGVPAVTASDPVGALAASQAAPGTLDGVPAYLASVIGRAMAPDPADRYPDAVALRDALAADGAPVDPNAMTAVVPIVGMATAGDFAGVPRPLDAPQPVAPPVPAQASPLPPLGPVDAPSSRRGSMRPGILTAGLVLVGLVLLALAGTSLLAGGTDGGTGSGVTASMQPTFSRPAPTAKPTAQPTPGPKPGKGKGKDKQDGQD
jgi:serine/threonine-protein kinase